ncbi:MAG: HEAT repeat domain-containing protein [Thiobacillus sp.]
MSAPDALLLISTHCPHCSTVLAALADMVKQGQVGKLEVVNLEAHPDVAQTLGVRSVPWLKLGLIELAGLRSAPELRVWAAKAKTEAGMADFFHQLLKEGQMARVLAMLHADSAQLTAVLPIVGNVDASLNVRLGAGVLLEEFAHTAALQNLVPRLGELSAHTDARVRADASHYLGLSGSAGARVWLELRLSDEDPDVREIAAESLATLLAA